MADVTTIDDFRLAVIVEATTYLLETIRRVAAPLPWDTVVLTAGSNGVHSGPDDPHYHGKAIDVRTHNFPTRADKVAFVDVLQSALGKYFFVFLEDPDAPNEHVHAQVRRGCTYPPTPLRVGAPRSA